MINCHLNSTYLMKRTHQAIFLALMMATMSLAGCFGGDDKGSDEDETPVETLDDWQVHFANTASDLPECNDDERFIIMLVRMKISRYVSNYHQQHQCRQLQHKHQCRQHQHQCRQLQHQHRRQPWQVIDIGADAISPSQQINTAKQDATNTLIQSAEQPLTKRRP